MRFGIYRFTGEAVSRSVVSAVLVAEVEEDQWPEDEAALAEAHGGDFIQLLEEVQ